MTAPVARPSRLPLSPARRRRLRARNLLLLRLFWGFALLGLLAYTLWQPGNWPQKLSLWVLLTLLADEAGGWFGYLGAALGGLPFFSNHAPPDQWWIILPLVGAALIAALIVKHSGGPLVLPFALVIFALPIFAAQKLGPSLDTTLTLPGNAQFRKATLVMAVISLAFSFVRQAAGLYLRRRLEQPRAVKVSAQTD
ncbi:hypothetical protein [Deinococcus sp.]|uniref:hypothetical protein n=1 Tax=Deinococcus sp. TaxID=47478 RepID=UPI003C7E2496